MLDLDRNREGLTDDQLALIRVLDTETPLLTDEAAEQTGLPVRRVLSALTVLEIDGYAQRSGPRSYVRTVRLSFGKGRIINMAKKAEKYLVIVESPAKAKTIGKYLGPAYQVKACMGHLRDLPKSKLGVDVENDFEPNYRPIKGKEDIIRNLKQAAKESDAVYLATDPDREGEAISWHLKQLLDLPEDKTFRVTFNEITRKVVTESIRQPRGH